MHDKRPRQRTAVQRMPEPDAVAVWTSMASDSEAATVDGAGQWSTPSADILLDGSPEGVRIRVAAPHSEISRVAIRWAKKTPEKALVLGDAWERSYGDLRWEHIRPDRVLPWYWIANLPGAGSWGAGVRVRPGAFCSWTVDAEQITLWLDVRSGSQPVLLGERVLDVATVVWLSAGDEITPFDVHRELCRALCSDPMASAGPLVGCNNWYYAYGVNFTADNIVRDAAMIAELSGGHSVRPYCVIDAGWSEGGVAPGGPWNTGFGTFDSMPRVAERIRDAGARPGLWYRPLLSRIPGDLTFGEERDGSWPLDPSREGTLEAVRADIKRFREWGFDLIKHDFSTCDILDRFLTGPTPPLSRVPWSFADRHRTTAEVIIDFYKAIADSSGDAVVIGCNTIGHLAAGLVEVQRTGDDTSGRHWERTRRMGVNTLAFRLAQHGSFFALDADCVPSTPATPWEKNSQFLELVALSGTALFVSVDPTTRDRRVDADLRRAIAIALDGGAPGGVEPLDWQWASAPRRWRTDSGDLTFSWNEEYGVDPESYNV